MIPLVQTLRIAIVVDKLDEFQRPTGTGAATNVEGGKSSHGERAQVIVHPKGEIVEVTGKSPKVGNKRWSHLLRPGDAGAAIAKMDEVLFALDVSGGSALGVKRGGDVLFAMGNVPDLGKALGIDVGTLDSGYTRVDLRFGAALARREVVAGRDELAFWLGHYTGGLRSEVPA
jgi:hypothetical protein